METTHLQHRFGRRPRSFDSAIPHLSALRLGAPALSPPPSSVDYTKNMPADFGMMLNDRLGDCTCAAFYHAFQIFTFNASGIEITEPDQNVEKLYEEACGYIPLIPGPGPGGVEQDVLKFLVNTGAPIGVNGEARDKIVGFFEVDPRNIDDVKQVIYECGVAYIGFPVPSNIGYQNPVWDYDPNSPMTGDGHAVVLAGYDDAGAIVVSWGKLYKMTWAFITNIVDEIYGIVDNAWVQSTGLTPAGLNVTDLEVLMQAIKVGA